MSLQKVADHRAAELNEGDPSGTLSVRWAAQSARGRVSATGGGGRAIAIPRPDLP